jgi:hypothetical protein
MTTTTTKDATDVRVVEQRNIALTADFLAAAVDDPTILDNVPNGCVLILVPEDTDEAFIEANLALARDAIREGRDVYVRHLRTNRA